jgi:hypothetical protein
VQLEEKEQKEKDREKPSEKQEEDGRMALGPAGQRMELEFCPIYNEKSFEALSMKVK